MKRSLQILLSVVALGLTPADGEELIALFEEPANAEETRDTGSFGGAFRLSGESRVTHEMAKFGQGSLRIGANRAGASGASIHLRGSDFSGLGTEVRRMSIVCWVRPSLTDRHFGIVERRPGSGSGYWGFGFTGHQTLMFRMTDHAGEAQDRHSRSIASLIQPGEWIHFAMTYDEGEVRFYINGEPHGESVHFNGIQIPACDTNITSINLFRENSEETLVDDFAIFYDRLLSQEEIASVAEAGLQAFVEGGAR